MVTYGEMPQSVKLGFTNDKTSITGWKAWLKESGSIHMGFSVVSFGIVREENLGMYGLERGVIEFLYTSVYN